MVCDLFYVLLLVGNNCFVFVLVEYIVGNEDNFIVLMNKKVKELKLL